MHVSFVRLNGTTSLRDSLAATVSSLRRVRPRTPFWHLQAHTVPTKWQLYRQLLRLAPTDNIRSQVQMLFRRYSHLTSPSEVRTKLHQAQDLLNLCQTGAKGDEMAKSMLELYDRRIAARRRRDYYNRIFEKELKWQERLRNRPIMTGGYMRPTVYNPPLPRLKPQPAHISGMIITRKRVRARRQAESVYNQSILEEMALEVAFEKQLLQMHPQELREPVFSNAEHLWVEHTRRHQSELKKHFYNETQRSLTPFSPEMVKMIRNARREKIRNKTHERERERRGELTKSAMKRLRKAPPARVRTVLKPQQLLEDAVRRSPSEGGWTGATKRRLGMRLKVDENAYARKEDGRAGNQAALAWQERQVRIANSRKRYQRWPDLLKQELEQIDRSEPDV